MSRVNIGIVVFASDTAEAKSVAEDKINMMVEDTPNKFFECGEVYDACLLDSKKAKKFCAGVFGEMKSIFIHAINEIKLELQKDVQELWNGMSDNTSLRIACQDVGVYAGPALRLYSEHFHTLRDQKSLDAYIQEEQKEQDGLTPYLVMVCMSY